MTRTCSAGTASARVRSLVSLVFPTLVSLAVAGVLTTSVAVAAAQPDRTASVIGKVTDSHGGVIAGATITVSGDNGIERQVVSGADGSYALRDLPRGRYRIVVS